MEIVIKRTDKNAHRSIGSLSMPGFSCHSLEDTDRGLTSEMPLDQIKAIKVYGKTAIPTGRYEVVISYSNRFKKMLPLLIGVPGFEGIRIHAGNTDADTDGCILPGMNRSIDSITESRSAMVKIMAILMKSLKKEKCYVVVS